jgi:hypothetical protein
MPRNVSGTYTLPLPPVVPNTVIQAAWGNTTTEDIAQGITDSLDRQGRGGMLAPFRLPDGGVLQPAWAFNAETGTGAYRESPGVLSFAIMGVKVGQFSAAGFKANLVGPFTVTGAIDFIGATPSFARIGIGFGTALLPSLYFTGDPDTGLFTTGSGISFSVDGVSRMALNLNGTLAIDAPTNAASPVLALTCAAGAFGIDIRGRAVDDLSVIRLLNNAYTVQRFQISVDNANAVIGTTAAIPMQLFTNGAARINISAAGNVTFAAPGAGTHNINGPVTFAGGDVSVGGSLFAQNFWVGNLTTSAGTFGVANSNGAAIVTWGSASAGAGAIDFVTGLNRQVQIGSIGGAVNYWEMYGAVPGGRVTLEARGADAAIGQWFIGKGAGDILFSSNGGNILQLLGNNVGARWFQMSGATALQRNPTIGVTAGHMAVTSGLRVNGSGSHGSELDTSNILLTFQSVRFIDMTRAANAREVDFLWGSGSLFGRFVNDADAAAANWLQVTGNSASVDRITFSSLTPSTGGVTINSSGSTSGLDIVDTGAAGANIKLSGNGGVTPNKFIRATGGDFQILNNSYAALLLGITDAGVITDNRGLPIARDPGASAAAHAIGSIIMANVGGLAVNALATINAATNNLTITATGAGSNLVVNSGTWRNIGARDTSTGFAMWLRTA